MRDERAPWLLWGKEDDSSKGNDHGGADPGEGDESGHSDTNGVTR